MGGIFGLVGQEGDIPFVLRPGLLEGFSLCS